MVQLLAHRLLPLRPREQFLVLKEVVVFAEYSVLKLRVALHQSLHDMRYAREKRVAAQVIINNTAHGA